MSLFNCVVGARLVSRAGIVALADTARSDLTPDGAVVAGGRTSKLLTLPHLSGVVVGQGPQATILAAFMAALETRSPEIADVGPRIAADVRAVDRDWRARHATRPDLPTNDTTVVLAGWSPRRREPVAYVYGDAHGWPVELSCGAIGTGLSELEAAAVSVANRQVALDLARKQWRRLSDDQRRSGGFGGPAVVCEIAGPGDISLHRAWPFEAPDKPPLHAIAAIGE